MRELIKDHLPKAIIETITESVLILDDKLRVVFANTSFYKTFQVLQRQTEGKFVYELGNGQWDIPTLKKLLEEILPQKKNVEDYEVIHTFQTIGKKICC